MVQSVSPCPGLQAPSGQVWSGLGVSANQSCHGGHARGHLQDRKSPVPCRPSCSSCMWPARYPCSSFLTDFQRDDTKPRPHTKARLGPSFTTTGRREGAACDSGSWFPTRIWPRRLVLMGTLCPSALEMACLRLPRLGLSQPHLENAFYLREACSLNKSL